MVAPAKHGTPVCFGEIALPKHDSSASEALFAAQRNIQSHASVLCVRGLAIRAERLRRHWRTVGGAGCARRVLTVVADQLAWRFAISSRTSGTRSTGTSTAVCVVLS